MSLNKANTAILATAIVTSLAFTAPVTLANQSAHAPETTKTIPKQSTSVKDDYVLGCKKGVCAEMVGSAWSSENPNGVAISIAMGTKTTVSDEKIKAILTREFTKSGVSKLKFVFEQNDIENTGVSFHVRGGVDGPYFLNGEIFKTIQEVAARAKVTDPVLMLKD